MKAVFDTKPTSAYNDDVSRHYQFGKRYLQEVERCVGDRVVFRRPRADGGDLAYFGSAQISHIAPDPKDPSMAFAIFRDFMQFDRPVPWRVDGRYWEEDLRNTPRHQIGTRLQGRSVRPLSDEDFAAILAASLSETLAPENSERLNLPQAVSAEARSHLHQPMLGIQDRRIELVLTNRIIREASFRSLICKAYQARCAVSRLQIHDNSGNPEVQAAHIWAVADGGTDVVQNGIALCATVHWLFDRHVMTIDDDYRLIVANTKVPVEFQAAFGRQCAPLHLPKNPSERPYPSYLAKHRALFWQKNSGP